MEGTKQDLFKRFDDFRRWNEEVLDDIKIFQSLGAHTDDVDMCMKAEVKIAKRAKQELFTPWRVFRFKILKAHPRMLSSMEDIGGEYSYYAKEAAQAWKSSDSQHVRGKDPALYERKYCSDTLGSKCYKGTAYQYTEYAHA